MVEIAQQDFMDLLVGFYKDEQAVFWIRDETMTQQLYVSKQYENVWAASCAELYENPRSWAQYYIDEEISFSKYDEICTHQHASMYYAIQDKNGNKKMIKDRNFKLYNPKTKKNCIIGVAVEVMNDQKKIANVKLDNEYYYDMQNQIINILTKNMCFSKSITEKEIILTKRESQVLYYVLRGQTAKAIAQILNISTKAIEFHIANLKLKFNCFNKSQLIEKAIYAGYMALTLNQQSLLP